jgi:dihydroorotase
MLTAVSEGRLTINRLVELMSFNPAKIFGVAKRGLVTEGNFADLAIVDPHDEYVYKKDMVATKCGWSNYVGRKFVGKVVYTFVNGNLVFDRGSVNYGTHGSQIRPAF